MMSSFYVISATLLFMLVLVLVFQEDQVKVTAYSTSSSTPVNNQQQTQTNKKTINRLSFLQTTLLASSTVFFPTPSLAKDIDPALKGTKNDPEYQACLSKCVFECTKPKGDEQKTRAECLPECKVKCATTKQQLMVGSPKAD